MDFLMEAPRSEVLHHISNTTTRVQHLQSVVSDPTSSPYRYDGCLLHCYSVSLSSSLGLLAMHVKPCH
jgi:hypothetical protein